VSGERGERAVRARVVVEHRRDLPRGAGAGHAIDIPVGARARRTGQGVDSRTERWQVWFGGCTEARSAEDTVELAR
jgi:hypothetical protein